MLQNGTAGNPEGNGKIPRRKRLSPCKIAAQKLLQKSYDYSKTTTILTTAAATIATPQ
jgi:hypothetical protein